MYNFQQKLTLKLCKYKCVLCMTIIAQRKESKGRYIGENFLSTVEIGLILNWTSLFQFNIHIVIPTVTTKKIIFRIYSKKQRNLNDTLEKNV